MGPFLLGETSYLHKKYGVMNAKGGLKKAKASDEILNFIDVTDWAESVPSSVRGDCQWQIQLRYHRTYCGVNEI